MDTTTSPRPSWLRFPAPLRPGDRIGVTSPSTGASGEAAERVDFAVRWLTDRGHPVTVGRCMDGTSHVSAPKAERAAELTAMLCDPEIRLVIPPWGGETAVDLVDQLDWDAIAAAEPTWVVGYSDMSTLLVPLTLRTGWATLHGDNLADTPYVVPDGLVHWTDLAASTGPVTQRDSGVVAAWWRFHEDPYATEWRRVGEGAWSLHGAGSLDVTGRLIGGCIETLVNLTGSPYGDVPGFAERCGDEGTVVYLEACDDNAYTICRNLHGLRLAGWFTGATAVLVGRTNAPDSETMTQREAVLDALGDLGLPIVFDLEIGHVPPHLPLVNGALARVVVDGERREIIQTLA
ncbi:MAG: S66 peptidase family protein [Nocardioides sp.]|uniref:S66 family peptidase n=1 Tax=Nocardioides sp. TaxID=35761 RepID=UPI003F09098F